MHLGYLVMFKYHLKRKVYLRIFCSAIKDMFTYNTSVVALSYRLYVIIYACTVETEL